MRLDAVPDLAKNFPDPETCLWLRPTGSGPLGLIVVKTVSLLSITVHCMATAVAVHSHVGRTVNFKNTVLFYF